MAGKAVELAMRSGFQSPACLVVLNGFSDLRGEDGYPKFLEIIIVTAVFNGC